MNYSMSTSQKAYKGAFRVKCDSTNISSSAMQSSQDKRDVMFLSRMALLSHYVMTNKGRDV